jgi:hypothetical protein
MVRCGHEGKPQKPDVSRETSGFFHATKTEKTLQNTGKIVYNVLQTLHAAVFGGKA